MPFTFSHPAIVLPLKNILGRHVSLIALIIGSLTPDFEYFLRMKMYGEYGHTFYGVLGFDLPLGIILYLIFHRIIKKPLIENSPRFIQGRLAIFKNDDGFGYFKRHYFIVIFSIIIGAYSHLFWDLFTHHNTCFVNYFELHQTIANTTIPFFKLLQHLSSVIGMLFIFSYLLMMKQAPCQYTQPKLSFWFKIIIFASSIFIIRIYFLQNLTQYGDIIVSGITSGIVALIIVCLNEKLKIKKSP
ncbi:DUF4184 family protein [Pasteurella atlantica]|uniref:DUF4184 family protein n=2 Tax=Pasteurellaceae TaxID=712 RepID=A0ACC6HNY8_9PAST|nr:DUF4184 family protein [Pasteurella atlantica]MDP8052585.1 DUF4184 family protein [Pasteurella atlantica]MDP8099530.1 DUF4184 family protein [Pasteurella atlantica]MDP8105655.1 DUF4184 family protein [Pasteurella atlantica]MDP8107482.1 DUF4184 family protein [Pasteurella atlantica]MDP8117110.1 DUF4184 family protein [Pasteurella atlantica]